MKRTKKPELQVAKVRPLDTDRLAQVIGGTSEKGDNTVANVLKTRHDTT